MQCDFFIKYLDYYKKNTIFVTENVEGKILTVCFSMKTKYEVIH